MTPANKNLIEMIDAFETYEARGIFDDYGRNDKFLRYLLDRTKVPSYRRTKKVVTGQKNGKDIVKNKRLTLDELTTEQLVELKEVQTLLNGKPGGHWSYANDEKTYVDYADFDRQYNVLRDLIMKFPPVLQEQVLIIAIVIYVLRELDADFDSDSAAFGEFYYNYKDIVTAY